MSDNVSVQCLATERAWEATSTGDPELDRLLTQSFHDNGLPGVGVHISHDDGGEPTMILYGFVATATERDVAEGQANEILRDFDFSISDRIEIRPELLALNPGHTGISRMGFIDSQ